MLGTVLGFESFVALCRCAIRAASAALGSVCRGDLPIKMTQPDFRTLRGTWSPAGAIIPPRRFLRTA